MKYNIISYLIREGFKNVLKNKKTTGASFIIMCLTMLVFGLCIIAGQNINNAMNQLEVQQPMQVFIQKDATQKEIDELRAQITNLEEVGSVDFISREEALKLNIETIKETGETAEGLFEGWEDDNPFRASFVVRLKDLKDSKKVENKIKNLENVSKYVSSIQMKSKLMDALINISWGLNIAIIATILVLIAISTFIIVYTIKLSVYSRRKEISIMKYVGATNGFIRWPFIIEGIIIGIISAFIYNKVSIGMGDFNLPIKLLTFSELFNTIIILYLILGAGIGAFGSIISMRKYLKV